LEKARARENGPEKRGGGNTSGKRHATSGKEEILFIISVNYETHLLSIEKWVLGGMVSWRYN